MKFTDSKVWFIAQIFYNIIVLKSLDLDNGAMKVR